MGEYIEENMLKVEEIEELIDENNNLEMYISENNEFWQLTEVKVKQTDILIEITGKDIITNNLKKYIINKQMIIYIDRSILFEITLHMLGDIKIDITMPV